MLPYHLIAPVYVLLRGVRLLKFKTYHQYLNNWLMELTAAWSSIQNGISSIVNLISLFLFVSLDALDTCATVKSMKCMISGMRSTPCPRRCLRKTSAATVPMMLEALDADRAFLTEGGVFTEEMIDAYIELKMEEVERIRMTTHPIEFDMYYSC